MQYGVFKNDRQEIKGRVVILGNSFPVMKDCVLELVEKEIFDESSIVESLLYRPNLLIDWAMDNVFSEDLIPHAHAFNDFANKANDEAKVSLLKYATLVGKVAEANLIINKAIEFGANITAEV